MLIWFVYRAVKKKFLHYSFIAIMIWIISSRIILRHWHTRIFDRICVHIACPYVKIVFDYQVGNLGISQYLVKLNIMKDSIAVGKSHVIWMKPTLVINIW